MCYWKSLTNAEEDGKDGKSALPAWPHRILSWLSPFAFLLLVHTDLAAKTLRKNILIAPVAAPVTVEIRLPQSEIGVQSTRTSADKYGGGLVGSLMAIHENKNKAKIAEQRVNVIRDQLVGVNFQNSLVQRFEGGVNPTLLPILGEVRYFDTDEETDVKAGLVQNQKDLLTVKYSYALIDDFKALRVTMQAALWDRDIEIYKDRHPEERIKDSARYFQQMHYDLVPVEVAASKDPAYRASQWLEMDKDKLSSMILSGMAALVEALEYDLATTATEPGLGKVDYFDTEAAGLKANLIKETSSQRWARSRTGELYVFDYR